MMSMVRATAARLSIYKMGLGNVLPFSCIGCSVANESLSCTITIGGETRQLNDRRLIRSPTQWSKPLFAFFAVDFS
jgi:hypothetical protein